MLIKYVFLFIISLAFFTIHIFYDNSLTDENRNSYYR